MLARFASLQRTILLRRSLSSPHLRSKQTDCSLADSGDPRNVMINKVRQGFLGGRKGKLTQPL